MHSFTLEYWITDGWHIGRLKEVPGVISQGATLEELQENIKDAYKLLLEESQNLPFPCHDCKEIQVSV